MEKIQQWLVERQTVYALFGALYRGDLHTGLHIIRDTALLQHFVENVDCDLIHHAARRIIKEMDEHQYDAEYEKFLMQDYYRLFVGPGHILAPPWESVYRTKEKLLFGEPDFAVRRYYQLFGLAVNAAESADHLSVELSFMARLCAGSMVERDQVSDEILESQRMFLKEHLLTWVPVWADNVSNNARTDFWGGFAVLTRDWLKNDLVEVQEVIDVRGK